VGRDGRGGRQEALGRIPGQPPPLKGPQFNLEQIQANVETCREKGRPDGTCEVVQPALW
jgi:hypothetical protein